MQSKRISTKPSVDKQLSPSEEHIEVPAGSHRFVIKQNVGEVSHIFHLRESGSEVTIIGFVDADAENTPTLTTEVIHHAPHTRAETLVKTLSRDKAEPRYTGKIRIEEGSHSCESYLNHHSLLIGDKAQSWTTPSLEILNNEVKCSHAATLRTLTPTDLFYLQARGLSPKQAEDTLIEAFLSDVQN